MSPPAAGSKPTQPHGNSFAAPVIPKEPAHTETPPADAAVDASPSLIPDAAQDEPTDAKFETGSRRYPFHLPLPSRATGPKDPAKLYATLSPLSCRTELRKRKLKVRRVGGNIRGIATPLRLPKTLNGVRLLLPPRKSKWSLLDCRLALTLDDLTKLLAKQDIVAMAVGNFYRPWSKLNKRAKSQHHYGLAADIVSFTLNDGRKLDVQSDFQANVGDTVCGPNAVINEVRDESVRLRNLVCAVARAKLFHHMLTPSFNLAHRDHFHWDIKRKGYAVILR